MTVVDSPTLRLDAGLREAFAQPLQGALLQQALGAAISAQTALETGSTSADLLAQARERQPARPVLRGSAAAPVALACGVAVADVLHAARVPVELKWPNDLLLNNRKLGGILTELALDGAGAQSLIAGVGINLWTDASLLAGLDRAPACLAECFDLAHLATQREAWIARLGRAVVAAVQQFERHGFVPFQPRFMQRLAWRGREVEVIEHGARVAEGRMLGVDGGGRLLVQVTGRVVSFNSGEVSLRAHDAEVSRPN
jgi:biotin-[acetyl-CoA-carboxylase] ligase BirA-like protein